MTPPPSGDVVKTNPDPTVAVVERLELLSATIDEKFKIRDDATKLAREEMKDTLASLSSAINDKFSSNEKLVSQLAVATKDLVDQLGKANALALAAALSTQKESASKFEVNVADLLKGLESNFKTALNAANEKLEVLRTALIALTSRIDLGQGGFINNNDHRRDTREVLRDNEKSSADNRSFIVAIVAAVIAGAALFVGLGLHK